MKKLAVMFLFLLFAARANAATIYLGTPFSHNGDTHVPIMGSGLPADLFNIFNIKLTFTGTATAQVGPTYLGNVWPNNYPTLPTCYTSVVYDDIGLGYSDWYLSTGYSNGGSQFCGLAAPSGMLGTFIVTGSGTVQMSGTVTHAEDCLLNTVSITIGENVAEVGQGGGGGGGGGCCHEEGVMVGEAPKAPAKARTTWGRIKALYR